MINKYVNHNGQRIIEIIDLNIPIQTLKQFKHFMISSMKGIAVNVSSKNPRKRISVVFNIITLNEIHDN